MKLLGCLPALPLLTGCIHLIEEHDSPVGEVTRDCVVTGATDAPVSLEYPGHSLWIWEDASARMLPGECAVELADPVLTLTADELAENAARTDGKQLALAPTGGLVANDAGFLYYDLVLRGPGLFDSETLGTGLCVIAPGEDVCVRDGAVLWTPEERVLNRGGLVDGDQAIIAGCRKVAAFEDPCTITGVAVDDLRDPAAYRPYDVFNGWVDELTDASVFADAAGALTIAPFGDGYVATTMNVWQNRVELRYSSSAVADYGHSIVAFDVTPPAEWFVRGGREHAGLREDPRDLVVSYGTDDGLHLVTFRVTGALE